MNEDTKIFLQALNDALRESKTDITLTWHGKLPDEIKDCFKLDGSGKLMGVMVSVKPLYKIEGGEDARDN